MLIDDSVQKYKVMISSSDLTFSKVKFRGITTELFAIETRASWYRFCLTSFCKKYCNVKKSNKRRKNWRNLFSLGRKRQGFKVECLAFTDYLALLTTVQKPNEILENFHEIARNSSTNIFREKTEYMGYKHARQR